MVADHFESDAVSLLRVADSVVQEKPTSIPAVVTQAGFVRDQIERVLAVQGPATLIPKPKATMSAQAT